MPETPDVNGFALPNVRVPISSRLKFGLVGTATKLTKSTMVTAPTGEGWFEAGLATEDGAPAYNFTEPERTNLHQSGYSVILATTPPTITGIFAEWNDFVNRALSGKGPDADKYNVINASGSNAKWYCWNEILYSDFATLTRVSTGGMFVAENQFTSNAIHGRPFTFTVDLDTSIKGHIQQIFTDAEEESA